jgi:tRNA dimethylallyltransferase
MSSASNPGLWPSTSEFQPILIAGPTAIGKSEVALLLAERLGGEIVAVDSMQVYRGLDIGTAKPSAADRARVPHHLLDVVNVTESFDAAKFTELGHKAVAEIQSRKHVPILCGGTGLYFKAFLEGLGEAPPADRKLRAELEATPLDNLLQELKGHDPVAYKKIDRQNPRRVIRAVEVIRLTSKPFSAQRARWGETTYELNHSNGGSRGRLPHQPIHAFGFSCSAAHLHSRIDARVDEMFRRGLVEETRYLLEHGLAQNKTAMQAIGYRQVVEHLRGGCSLPETIELVKIRTHQFAKRQMTWFRRQLKLEWIELKPDDKPDAVACLVEARLKG